MRSHHGDARLEERQLLTRLWREVGDVPINDYYKWDRVYGGWSGYNGTKAMNSQTVTFTFSTAVTGLTFTITDIDSTAYDYWDLVSLSGSSTYTTTKATGVLGTGTSADPLYYSSSNTPMDDQTSKAGNVTVAFAGPVTSMSLVYSNGTRDYAQIDGDQGIYLTPFTFTYKPC